MVYTYTQNTIRDIYFRCFTDMIWSYLLTPVIVVVHAVFSEVFFLLRPFGGNPVFGGLGWGQGWCSRCTLWAANNIPGAPGSPRFSLDGSGPGGMKVTSGSRVAVGVGGGVRGRSVQGSNRGLFYLHTCRCFAKNAKNPTKP